MSLLNDVISNPCLRIEGSRFKILAEIFTNKVIFVPVFKGISIVLKIRVLAPSFETFYRGQSLNKCLNDGSAECLLAWLKLDPIILNIGSCELKLFVWHTVVLFAVVTPLLFLRCIWILWFFFLDVCK